MYIRVILLLGLCFTVSTQAANLLQQRFQFKQTYQAIQKQDLEQFQKLSEQLQDYEIAHYLNFFQLYHHIEQAKADEVQSFLEVYADSPTADILRTQWLTQLAKSENWVSYQAFYQPQKNTILQCHALNARLQQQEPFKQWQMQAIKLWLVGKSQPKECDPVFSQLYKNNIITSELRWQRTRLSLQNKQFKLANYLAKSLGQDKKTWVAHWQSVHKNPAAGLKNINYPDDNVARELLIYGTKRLARRNAKLAHDYWAQFKKTYGFTESEKDEIDSYIALWAADQKITESLTWLMSAEIKNDKMRQSMLNIALDQNNWAAIIKFVTDFNDAIEQQDQWQYWLARAYGQTEKFDKAKVIFEKVAKHRTYYGFLAAERLQQPFAFEQQESELDKAAQQKLLENPALIRARELYFLGFINYARMEWQQAVKTLNQDEMKLLTAIASQWGWHDRAIRAASKADLHNHLSLRFPRPYYDWVLNQSEKREIAFGWIYAIIRQESAFQTDAKSGANAMGLMQLLPATARQMANKYKIKLGGEKDLLSPEKNIELGTSYLRYLLDKFDDNYLLATAAYNAGPARAKRWREKYSCIATDMWVELIPFSETRKYVKRVMSYTVVFEYLMLGHDDVEPMRLNPVQEQGC
ncbi:transglycosylase SLT domain-containing protein [Candidatus Albibeggiatoa sp. nov. BB20]|uniref:transglycosylase SLT domain-containing protein n=1 Tax=Candidatus Albibeggiatoa sp. nov. BB20 TaxID=3162723 RepID=UPI0033659EDE